LQQKYNKRGRFGIVLNLLPPRRTNMRLIRERKVYSSNLEPANLIQRCKRFATALTHKSSFVAMALCRGEVHRKLNYSIHFKVIRRR